MGKFWQGFQRFCKCLAHQNLCIRYQYPENLFRFLPFFIAEMQTCIGGDTATVRSQNMSMTAIEIKKEEEQSRESEVRHTKEVVD